MSFKDLKKRRKDFNEELKQTIEENQKKKYDNQDERLWFITAEKREKSEAIVWLLPNKTPGEKSIRSIYTRAFKNAKTNRWYIENCLSSLKEDDPVGQANSWWWDRGEEDLARHRRRIRKYYMNVLIVDDQKNPENNGTVKMMKCGAQVFNVIKEFKEEGGNPFDMWEPKYLKIISKIGSNGQRNYETSHFIDPPEDKKITGDDKLEKIYNSTYSFEDFIEFKSYEDLKKRFLRTYPEEKEVGVFAAEFTNEKFSALDLSEPERKPKPKPEEEDIPPWEKNDDGEAEAAVANAEGEADEEVDNFFENI